MELIPYPESKPDEEKARLVKTFIAKGISGTKGLVKLARKLLSCE